MLRKIVTSAEVMTVRDKNYILGLLGDLLAQVKRIVAQMLSLFAT